MYIGTIPSSMDNNRCSVTLEDDGSVTFICMPNANKVEVAGMGRLFQLRTHTVKAWICRGAFRQILKISTGQMHYYFWYVDDVSA